MKKLFSLLLALMFTVAFVACGGGAKTEEGAAEEVVEEATEATEEVVEEVEETTEEAVEEMEEAADSVEVAVDSAASE